MKKISEGQIVRYAGDGCDYDGELFVVTRVNANGTINISHTDKDHHHNSMGPSSVENYLTIVNSNGEQEMSLIKRVRDLTLSKEEKLRRKYNIVDECGQRTDEGTELLLDLLFEQNLASGIDPKLALIAAEDKAEKK